jgi:hypothetical protein
MPPSRPRKQRRGGAIFRSSKTWNLIPVRIFDTEISLHSVLEADCVLGKELTQTEILLDIFLFDVMLSVNLV